MAVRSIVKGETGASMVEFALVLAVFMALLFGIIQGGLIFGSWIIVTNAAREGARFGSPCISRAELPEVLGNARLCVEDGTLVTLANVETVIEAHTREAIVWPDPDDPQFLMNIDASFDPQGSPSPRLVKVTVDYVMPILFPLVLEGADPRLRAGAAFPLRAESAMRVEE